MKGLKMHTLKKTLLAGTIATGIFISLPVFSASNTGAWVSTGISGASSLISAVNSYGKSDSIHMGPAINIDAVQLALEATVLLLITNTKYEWDPKPAKEYEKAASSNGGSDGTGQVPSTIGVDDLVQPLPFQVASLHNVGIEAIDIGPELSEIATQETREKILSDLTFTQLKSSASSSELDLDDDSDDSMSSTGAGSCSASYAICLQKGLTDDEKSEISAKEKLNQQLYGTAGVTHAELGLKSVKQAILNDGGSIGDAGASSSNTDLQSALATGGTLEVQDLTGLIGKAQNTVWAMKVVATMNLELAQRLNQGNMLQGSTLTIEAARALRYTSDKLKEDL